MSFTYEEALKRSKELKDGEPIKVTAVERVELYRDVMVKLMLSPTPVTPALSVLLLVDGHRVEV